MNVFRFKLIFNWSLRLLPIGLGCILAGQLANLSLDVFRALVTFIGLFYVTAFFLGCLYSLVLWYSLGGGHVLRGLKALSKPLLLAYTVDSSLVALSACLEILEQDLHVDKRITGLLLPFGMIANRQGKICLFAFATVFLAQVHDVPLDLGDFLVVLIASALTGMAAMGSGVILASALVVVLHAVTVPEVLAPLVLIVAGPLVDRIQSTMTVLANCTLAALVAKPRPRAASAMAVANPLRKTAEPETY